MFSCVTNHEFKITRRTQESGMSLYDDDDLPQISSTAAAPGWSQARRILKREKSETQNYQA